MDFKLILLLLGLGHLAVVVIYALWGFLGGLKRELKCTAVLFVILLLGWLIFSDPAMMMGIQLPGQLLSLLSELGVEAKAASVWEVIVQVLRNIPELTPILEEGSKGYELTYNLVAGVLRGVGLIGVTLLSLYLSGLIRFVSHFVKAIVTMVKKAKAKKALPVEAEETSTEEEPEQVVLLGGLEGADDVVVTTDVNELPAPKPISQRLWGAVVGLIKACVVLCITFVPLSGIVSILDETSEETRGIISDLVSGEEKVVEGESNNIVDIVFDFVEDYKSSPLGLGVESTSYFFGDSFSTLLFDQLFFFQTDTQRIPLRTELVTFIHAINALEGDLDYKNLEQEKLGNALDELKDSQLLPEILPVAIEFAYGQQPVKDALVAAGQDDEFLQLRNCDWDKDLEKILDAVKVVYSLDIFAEDFNFLTLDVNSVRQIVELLSSTDFLPKTLPIGVKVAVKLEAVQNLIQNSNFEPNLKEVDWANDLDALVDVYEDFQRLGLESLEGLDKDTILSLVFENDDHTDAVKDILSDVVNMDLFTTLVAPIAEYVVDAEMAKLNNGQFKSLVGVLPIKELSAKQWESDLHKLVDIADRFYELDVFGFEIVNMDLSSPEAVSAFKYAIDEIFGTLGEDSHNGLNILAQNDALLKVIDWAFKNFDLVDLDADLSINSNNINLAKEGAALKKLIDVYGELAKYPEFDINNMKFDFLALLEKEDMGEIVTTALEALTESDIILNTLVPIIEHKVVPLVSKYEDAEDLVKDIIYTNASDSAADIINELNKLVAAVFGAKDLGLLAVPKDGLEAIDFAKTDEMIAIVNAVLDTELFKGFEARIIKVLLKVAKIDVELSELQKVDFTSDQERQLIVRFIETIAPVLKSDRFDIFEGNKIVFTDEFKQFLCEPYYTQKLVDGLQVLFGDYETKAPGSGLVTVLLHPIYNQFLAEKLPAQAAELLNIIDINKFTPEELTSDVSAVVYLVDQLVEFNVLSVLLGKPGDINFEAGHALPNAVVFFDTLGEINVLSRRFPELLAYGINFAVEKVNAGQAAKGKNPLFISNVRAQDFDHVVLAEELDLISQVVCGAIRFLNDNAITQVVHLNQFIQNKEYLTEEFLTEENGNALIDVIEPLTQSNILPVVVKAAEKQIYVTLANVGLDLEHTLNVSDEAIKADLATLLGVVRKAVDFGALEFVYAKDISDIDYEILASVLYDENGADLSDLNILQKSQARIVSELIDFVLAKVAPKSDFTITQGDLKNANLVNDFEKLSQIVLVLGEVIEGLDLQSVNDIKAFAQNLKAQDLLKNEALINEANIERICEILGLVSEMTYFEAISPVAFNEVIMGLAKKEASIEKLYGSVSGAELAEDVKALSTLAQALKDAKLVEFVLGKSVYSLNEAAFAQVLETVLNTNLVNNNNVEIIKIVVGVINRTISQKVPALNGFEIVVETYLFDNFTAEDWAAEHKLFAETIAKVLGIAFNELGIVSINSAKAFVNSAEFKNFDFYTPELVEQLGDVVADVISLETVGALLPSVFDYAVDQARNAVVKGKQLGLDFLYILEAYESGKLTNDMLAEDIITLVAMGVELLQNGSLNTLYRYAKNNSINNMPLDFIGSLSGAVAKLGDLNILTLNSAKMATQLVNLGFRLGGLDYQAVEKDFAQLTPEQWKEDAQQLGQILVDAEALLVRLGSDAGFVPSINGISQFVKADAKLAQNYLTPELVDSAVALLQSVLSFNAGEKLITNVVNFLLPVAQEKLHAKPQFANVELDFLENTVSQATLHDDIATIGTIAKEAIAFGLLEYLETKDIAKLELVHIANIVDLFGELNLYNQAREGWYVNAATVASDATKKNFILGYEDLEGINFEEDNDQLQAVIMQLDALLKANKHESLSELMNFFKNLGATYEQWATLENGKAVVDILNGLADVDILMAAGASSVEYLVYVALTKNIDIRFLYDLPYKGADLSADVKIIAGILDEALEFGLIDLVWKYPLQDIDLTHVQNIVKYVDQLHLFGLDKANWTALIVNTIAKAIKMNVEVEAEAFSHVDWAKENANYVALIGKLQEILDENKFDSTVELNKFIKEAAYLSNQYVTETNVELIAQALDILAELDTLEVALPALVEFGMVKLGTGVEGDFTAVTSKDFSTLAYMIREIVAFGAIEMYYNILWNDKYFYEGEFDLSHIVNVVKALEELDVLAVDKAHLAQFIASKINLGFEMDLAALEAIDYSAENAKLVEIIETIDALMQNTYLTNLEFIYKWIEQEGYKSAQYIDDENVLYIAQIVELVSELQLLAPYAGEALDLVFLGIPETHHLVGQLSGEQVVEDLSALANIIRNLVEFDAIDLYFWQTTSEFKFDALRNAIELALNLNILNVKRADTMAIVLNKVFAGLKVNANYTAEDFANVDFAQDDATILAMYDQLVVLAREMNIEDTAMLKAYFDQKLYTYAHYTNETTIAYAVEMLDLLADLQQLEVLIDEVAVFALGQIKGLDLSFVANGIEKGDLTAEELLADVHKLVEIAEGFLDYGLYNMVYSNEYKAVDTDKFVEIFVKLDELHTLNEYRPEWSVLVVNKAFGSFRTISEADLAHITEAMWNDEIEVLANTIVALYDYLVLRGYADNGELHRLYKELKEEKKYQDREYLIDLLINDENGNKDEAAIDALLAVVIEASKSDVSGILLETGLEKVVEMLAKNGIDLAKLPEMVSVAELQADVELLAEAAKQLVMFGAIELVTEKGAIDYNNLERVYNAIRALFNTNLLNKDSGYVMGGLLKNETSRTTGYFSEELYLRDKAEALIEVIDDLSYVALAQGFVTVQDYLDFIANPKQRKFVVDAKLNATIDALAEALSVMSKDVFFAETILAGSYGYLATTLDKYPGISDIYKIYIGETLAEDLDSISNALEALCELDVYAIVTNKAMIPYSRVDVLEAVLTELLGVHYLNDKGRTDEIVAGLETFLKTDLTSLKGMNLDLAGDAAKLVAVYEELLVIFESEEWPYNYVSDFNDKSLSLEYILSDAFINASIAAFNELKLTSIYEETNGAILVVLLPIFKKVLPEYYEALNFENCSLDDQIKDFEQVMAMVERLQASSILDALRNNATPVDFDLAVEDVKFLMDKVLNIKLFADGSLEAVTELLLRDLVYGKTVYGMYFEEGLFTVTSLADDSEIIKQILDQALIVLHNANITSLNDIKALMNVEGIKEIVLNDSNLDAIADAMTLVSEMAFVKANATALWHELFIPRMEISRFAKYAKYIDYAGATNEQLVEDLAKGAQIVKAMKDLEVVAIYNGAAINYDQAAEIEALLTLIAELHYIELNHQRIYDFVARKVNENGGVMFGIEEFTIATDLPKFAKVYAELVPFFMDSAYPFTTLSQYLDILRTKQIQGKKDLVKLAYDHRSEFLDAYHVARESGLGKYALVLGLPAVKVVLPEYYAVLNLEGYTYEDLKADAKIGLEIAKRAKNSQMLDVLRHRGAAVIDFYKGVDDVEFMMLNALEMKLLGNGSFEELANLVLENYIYDKSVAGIYVADCNLDLTKIDTKADVMVLANIGREVAAIFANSGITTLGQVKAHANKAGVKALLLDEVNLEHIANAMELAAQLTVAQVNASNVWNALVLPRLEARGLDKLVTYQGATNAQLIEDLAKGAEIVRVMNSLEAVAIYNGAAINYDQADEIEALLTLISELNYFEVDEQTIFDFIASKVSALYHYNVSPQDLELAEDLVKLADVYRKALPILTAPEYPFTTLKQYLDILRTRNIPGKTALVTVVNNNMQAAVDTYDELLDLDIVKYGVIGAYYKVSGLGFASSLVSLLDPSALTLAQIEEDLATSVAVAQALVNSGVKVGVKDGKLGILGSSVINFAELDNLVTELYKLNCLEGDFDAIVDVVASKAGLSLAGTYLAQDERAFVSEIFALAQVFEAELAIANLGDIYNYYKDINNTVELVMSNTTLQNAIVDFIDEAAKTSLGQDLVKGAYSQFAIPALPSDYQDFINFDDPSYTPDLWANDFANMFIIYNELEALNYGDSSFVPTIGEVDALYQLLFIFNTPYSVNKAPQAWLEKLFFNSLPTLGAFAPEYSAVTDWDQEILAIHAILNELANILGTNKEVLSLSMADFYELDQVSKAYDLLVAIRASKTMRSLTIAIIDEAIESSSSSSAKINLEELRSAEFDAQITPAGYAYNEAYWTDAELNNLAKILVYANELLHDEFGNFDASAFDFTNTANFGDYYNSPLKADTSVDASKLGLGHLLGTLYVSNTFDLESLGGPTGLIANEMGSFISNTSLIGEIDAEEDIYEILDAIKAVNAATNNNLNALGIETVYNNISDAKVVTMIDSIKDSDVLRGMLPFLMNQLVVEAATQNGIAPTLAFQGIKLFVDANLGAALESPNATNASVIYNTNASDLISAVEYIKTI